MYRVRSPAWAHPGPLGSRRMTESRGAIVVDSLTQSVVCHQSSEVIGYGPPGARARGGER